MLRFSRAPERDGAEREALAQIRSIVIDLIARLEPIALADTIEAARALAEALEPDRTPDNVTPIRRGPRH